MRAHVPEAASLRALRSRTGRVAHSAEPPDAATALAGYEAEGLEPAAPGGTDGASGVPLDAWPSQDAKRPRRASRLAGALRFRPGNKGGPCLSASDIYLPEMAP